MGYREKADTSECYFCDSAEDIEVHHIIPRSLGGSDDVENLVGVCSSCHTKLERLYNSRFWNELGFESPQQTRRPHNECERSACVKPAVVRLNTRSGDTILLCQEHTGYDMEFDRFETHNGKKYGVTVEERFATYEVEVPDLYTKRYDGLDRVEVGPAGEAEDAASQDILEWIPGVETI